MKAPLDTLGSPGVATGWHQRKGPDGTRLSVGPEEVSVSQPGGGLPVSVVWDARWGFQHFGEMEQARETLCDPRSQEALAVLPQCHFPQFDTCFFSQVWELNFLLGMKSGDPYIRVFPGHEKSWIEVPGSEIWAFPPLCVFPSRLQHSC